MFTNRLCRSLYICAFFCLFPFAATVHGEIPRRAGWWKFDNQSDLVVAEPGYGASLALVGTQSAASGPIEGNGSVLMGVGSYYKMQHLIAANGGGNRVNEYTLLYDFMVLANGVWHAFYQVDKTNADDGDFFINPSGNIGVGAVGYSGYQVKPNQWYRLVISVKNGSHFNCYLDGNLLMSGTVQPVDGRFSLDNMILIFADNDGEDGNIYCSELAIWNTALTATQASELGGFNHDIMPFTMTRIPYLQGDGPNTMTVCWHDTATSGTTIEYGLTSALGSKVTGTSEIISLPYRWHSVKLTGLQANTRYFYKALSGNGASDILSFKTLPDESYSGKIRFIILGDTHSNDTTMSGKVIRSARAKAEELYGPDIENSINGVFHTGDIVVSGNIPEQYSLQYFNPMAKLSKNISTKIVAGNHEGENSYFYKYLKLDDFSAYPQNPALNEKLWSQKIRNSVFIGLNANIINQYSTIEASWLDNRLLEAENDPDVDFIFIFIHHPPISELWYSAIIEDPGSVYVRNVLFPIIKKYTKVCQLNYGHTHGFERGTIMSGIDNADFRIICGGGGGGELDPPATNDYNDVHISLSNYCFQILEIDISGHSYKTSMYSLGNTNKPLDAICLDSWYKKLNQPGPSTPIVENAEISNGKINISSSTFSGVDSIMSVQLKVYENTSNTCVLDSIWHWCDINGIDGNSEPIDRNKGINLNQVNIDLSRLQTDKNYYFQIRYRDHNLKWSSWSNKYSFTETGINEKQELLGYKLFPNYPNPFQNETTIRYYIPEKVSVKVRILNGAGEIVTELAEGIKGKGSYQLNIPTSSLSSGIYYYQLVSNRIVLTKKMLKIW